MRRISSLPGLAVAVWVACLALVGLLGVMVAVRAWNPHFLPVTTVLALIVATGLALIIASSWRIVRGPGRRGAVSCLLIGAAPLWFLAGYLLFGLSVGQGRNIPLNLAVKLLGPLGESAMDLEARFRYPQRTAGEKVVMLSAPMPEAQARAQVAAMDRHIRALEGRLGRPTQGTIHWARGPLFGIDRHAVIGLCLGSRPGEDPPDAEGLAGVDRHEVAHCVLTSHCSLHFDPPAVLTEGWAQANQGDDPLEQAQFLWERIENGTAYTLRQLTGPDWYNRHEWPAYQQGAPLVNFLLDRFGPQKFIELYATCSQATFESDCRRILGLDLDGLDAALRDQVEHLVTQGGSVERRRLERLRLDPRVKAADWQAFLDEYFAAAGRMLAPYHHVRLTAAFSHSFTDVRGRTQASSFESRSLRSGEFASYRQRSSDGELAYLAHPRRSIAAHRNGADRPWEVEDFSRGTAEQARHRALDKIDRFDMVGRGSTAPLIALARGLGDRLHDGLVVAALERLEENGRPRVRVRIEDRSPPARHVPWRAITYVLAADDLYAAQSEQFEGVGPDDKATHRAECAHDRHEGIPVLRSERTTTTTPDGGHGTSELKVVERQFGPIPEEEFDPDRFLEGPQVARAQSDPFTDEPTRLARFYWLPFPIGALGLIGGAAMAFGARARLGS
jgi:hypothetical protein